MADDSNSHTVFPGRLIPPSELAPGPPERATREQCIAMWFDLVEATDQIFLATLRSRHKIDAALLGGIAVAAWNHVRNTRGPSQRRISR